MPDLRSASVSLAPESLPPPRPLGCREAALRVLHDSTTWSAHDLDGWMRDAYTSFVEGRPSPPATRSLRPPVMDVPTLVLQHFLDGERKRVIDALARSREESLPTWVMDAIVKGHVHHAGSSHSAWRPTHVPARLSERVLALLTVDFLGQPDRWAAVVACPTCRRVDFDGVTCEAHGARARRSTIVLSCVPA